MDPKWFPPEGRPYGPSLRTWMTFSSICLASTLVPPGKIRISIAVPALVYVASRCRMTSSGNTAEDYMVSINLAVMTAKWVDFLLLKTPERDVHRVDVTKKGSPLVREDTGNMTLWEKFKWSLEFWGTTRGIGWDWQVKNVDKVPSNISRRKFVLQSLLGYAKCYVVLDCSQHYMFTYVHPNVSTALEYWEQPLFRQILLAWITAINSGCGMALTYHLCAAVAVSTGLQCPQEWPWGFGSFTRKGYTMRNIWGYCWHQYLRQIFTTATSTTTRVLGIRKGSLASRYVQLYGAFIVSAAIHHIGALNIAYTPAVRSQMFFFLIQPVGITVEDVVVYASKKYGIKRSAATKAIGFLWVLFFLSFSLRYFAAFGFAMRASHVRHPLIWSIADRIL